MLKKILKWFPLFALLLLAGCRTSKQDKVSSEETTHSVSLKEVEGYKKKVVANRQQQSCVTGKMQFTLQAKGKEHSIGGQLRMKHNEVVQLSMAVLGFEVGRLEFAPDHVLIIDRVNKQFVRAAYSDVSFLRQAQLDFYALQALFWNQLFVPGQRDVTTVLSRFRYQANGSHVILSLEDTPNLNYRFTTQSEQALINRVKVESKNGVQGSMEWNYDRFIRLGGHYFPTVMNCKVNGLGHAASFSLQLNRLDNNTQWSTQTKISSRYKERSADELLKRLLSM